MFIISLPYLSASMIFKIILFIISLGILLLVSTNASFKDLPNFISNNVCLNSLDNSELTLNTVTSKAVSKFFPDSNDKLNISKKSSASYSNFFTLFLPHYLLLYELNNNILLRILVLKYIHI